MKLNIYDRDEQLSYIIDTTSDEWLLESFTHSEHDGILNLSYYGQLEYLYKGAFIAFEDYAGAHQMFEIVKTDETHTEKGLLHSLYCEHVFYELLTEVVSNHENILSTANEALTRALTGTRWSLGNFYATDQRDIKFNYETVLSALTKIQSTFGCRLRYRLTMNGDNITGRYVDIFSLEGSITGKRFEWSKDILLLERVIDSREILTALYGRGKAIEVEDEDGDIHFENCTFADITWTKPTNPADKPSGLEYIANPDALELWGRGAPNNKRHRFGIATFEDISDPDKLLQYTWEALKKCSVPKVSYTIKAVDLMQVTGENTEAFNVGDVVTIIDNAFSPSLEVDISITKIIRDYIYPENTRITMGNDALSLTGIVKKLSEYAARLRDKEGAYDVAADPTTPIRSDRLQGAIDAMANGIICSGEFESTTPIEGVGILLENKTPGSPSYGGLYLGPGIFAIADTMVDGMWQWKTFGTGAGFTADYINSGTINADLIKTGVLSSYNNSSWINMQNGSLSFANGAFTFNGQDTASFNGEINVQVGDNVIYIRGDSSGFPVVGFQVEGDTTGYIYAFDWDILRVVSNGILELIGIDDVIVSEGKLEVIGDNNLVFIRGDYSGYPLVGFRVDGDDAGYLYAAAWNRLRLESNGLIEIAAVNGIYIEDGPIKLPNGENGFTGSVKISGTTLYFNNGILYNATN